MKVTEVENVITTEHDNGRKDVTILAQPLTAAATVSLPGGDDESQ